MDKKTKEVVRQIKRYTQTGTKPWDYQTAAKDLSVQVGSLQKCIMQLNGERIRHGKSDAQLKREIAGELVDILSEVLFIAHELDIDLDEAWAMMILSDEQKITQNQA